MRFGRCWSKLVSTHSRPKAAGTAKVGNKCLIQRFNTQPPEGGWGCDMFKSKRLLSFNTQPPEGGWDYIKSIASPDLLFQHTAARRRLEKVIRRRDIWEIVSTHSRPKAAGEVLGLRR